MLQFKYMTNKTGSSCLWLPSIISDNMVIQADTSAAIWGKAFPKEKIIISIAGKTVKTRANRTGDFKVFLPELKPGGPYTLTINQKIINNVTTVW